MIFDPIYLLFIAPGALLSLVATILLKYWNSKYSKMANTTGYTGAQAADIIAQKYGYGIGLQQIGGTLSDHYDPRGKIVSLSSDISNRNSIAAVAIAAHEMGHVQQDFTKNPLLAFRGVLVPAVNIGSQLGIILIIAGLVLAFAGLAWVGLILFSLTFLFSFLTLPVEIDASRRALKMIKEMNLLTASEIDGARKVLAAAALTYIAAMLTSLGNVLYYALLISGMGKKD